uniref:Zinc finger, CCHC-type n=1 Tax=Tanacetum cinerariifolium TaxID=118510 RepID=A0A699IYZ0_TANCI|nr:zinc finger, CCHC-type [Tanacetum cinerariifolium]
MIVALSVESPTQVFGKKSMVAMEIIIELAAGECHWPATRPAQPQQQEQANEKEEADGRWGQLETWMTRQEQRSDWTYAHTVRQMQYLSMRDHLDPHMQIDPFPGREADYPPIGYTRPMPPGYDYRYNTAPVDFICLIPVLLISLLCSDSHGL